MMSVETCVFFQSHTHEFQCVSCCGNLAQPESNSEETQNRLEKQFLDDFFSKLQVFRIALELRKIALELRKIALELRPTILHFSHLEHQNQKVDDFV